MPGPNTTTEGTGWYVGVPPTGVGDVSGGTSGGRYLHLHFPSPEHSHTIHYKHTHYEPVSGGRSTPG